MPEEPDLTDEDIKILDNNIQKRIDQKKFESCLKEIKELIESRCSVSGGRPRTSPTLLEIWEKVLAVLKKPGGQNEKEDCSK